MLHIPTTPLLIVFLSLLFFIFTSKQGISYLDYSKRKKKSQKKPQPTSVLIKDSWDFKALDNVS